MLLYGAVCVLFSYFFLRVIIFPMIKRYSELNSEIRVNRLKLQKYARLLSQKDSILAKNDSLSKIMILSKEEGSSSVSALSELENLAKNANILILEIRPQSVKSTSLHKEMDIELKTEGGLRDYLKFMYDIEHSLSLLTVKKLKLSSQPNTQTIEGLFSISQLSITE